MTVGPEECELEKLAIRIIGEAMELMLLEATLLDGEAVILAIIRGCIRAAAIHIGAAGLGPEEFATELVDEAQRVAQRGKRFLH